MLHNKNTIYSEFLTLFFMEMSASVVAPCVNVVKSFRVLTHSLEEVCGLPGGYAK